MLGVVFETNSPNCHLLKPNRQLCHFNKLNKTHIWFHFTQLNSTGVERTYIYFFNKTILNKNEMTLVVDWLVEPQRNCCIEMKSSFVQ